MQRLGGCHGSLDQMQLREQVYMDQLRVKRSTRPAVWLSEKASVIKGLISRSSRDMPLLVHNSEKAPRPQRYSFTLKLLARF